jgi:hypothetical protein
MHPVHWASTRWRELPGSTPDVDTAIIILTGGAGPNVRRPGSHFNSARGEASFAICGLLSPGVCRSPLAWLKLSIRLALRVLKLHATRNFNSRFLN